jgi:hypothetical protein
VGSRTGLEDVEKRKFLILLGLETQPLGRPARSVSLYLLSYPGSTDFGKQTNYSDAIASNNGISVGGVEKVIHEH